MALPFILAAHLHGTLSTGQRYGVNFFDVDGHSLSTADGHVTVLVLTTTQDSTRARAVGDNVPDHCIGNENYRMITVLQFKNSHTRFGQAVALMLVRNRVNAEAKRLQARYNILKIAHRARQDVYVAADFDGTISRELGAEPGSAAFHVFVFGRDGELLHEWDDVPSAQELAGVVK